MKIKSCLIKFLFIFLYTNYLYSEIFDTANALEKNTFAIAFEPQYYRTDNKFSGALHVNYGLVDKIDANFRIGMGIDTIFAGFNLGYQLINSKIIDFSASFGYHYDGDLFFDYFFNLSHDFKYLSLYNGLAFAYQLTNEKDINLAYFCGSSFNLKNNNKIIIEAGFSLNNYYDWISIGIASNIK